MPSFPTVDLTIEDFAGLLGGDKDKVQQPPVQHEDAVPAASVPDPGAGVGQVPSVNINLQLPLRPAFPQGRKTNMFTVQPGFTPINRSEASGSLKAKFRTTTNAVSFGTPAQTGNLSTASRFKPVKTTNVFDFNAPMEPALRDPPQLDRVKSPPAFDFNAPLKPAVREPSRPDPIRDLTVIENNIQLESTVQEPTILVNLDQVAAEKPQVSPVRSKNWIFSSTIQIRDHVSALKFANDLCQSKDVGVTNNRLVVWTDGSAGQDNVAASAAIVYRQPLTDSSPSCWVARGFGIRGYAGGATLAESVAVAVALEAALDVWNSLDIKQNHLGTRSDANPVPAWIKKLTPSRPAALPALRRPLPFSFIDLTVDDGPAVEVIDLTGDDSDDSMTDTLPAATLVPENEPVPASVKPFQELFIFSDAQAVLNSCMSARCANRSATWHLVSNRIKSFMQQLFERGVVVHFHWVPAHSGIEGNERADHVCSVVRKAQGRTSKRAPAPKVWEIEGGLVEQFAMFGARSTSKQQRSHFERKQLYALKRWGRRPERLQKRQELRMKRHEMIKRSRHAGPETALREATLLISKEKSLPTQDQHNETIQPGEPRVTEERASGLGMPLRRSVRLAAGLIAKESGNTMATAIEIID